MNKVYFHLPGAFEQIEIYNTLIPIIKSEKEKFYDYFEIGSVYGASTNLTWSAGEINYNDSYFPAFFLRKLYDDNNIPISIAASNTLLEKSDLYDTASNSFVNAYHDDKNEIIIGSEELKTLISILYPKYKKISSHYKCLSKDETLDELNNGYDRVILNQTLNQDFDFLYSLNDEQKSKIEIILNPTCLNFCGHMQDHYNAMSYDILYKETTAKKINCEWKNKNFAERINASYTIKNNELYEKYIEKGFKHFIILDKSSKMQDLAFTLAYYLVKPEYLLEILYRILMPIINALQPKLDDMEIMHE